MLDMACRTVATRLLPIRSPHHPRSLDRLHGGSSIISKPSDRQPRDSSLPEQMLSDRIASRPNTMYASTYYRPVRLDRSSSSDVRFASAADTTGHQNS